MSVHHTITAEFRQDVGKGASRRLRRAGRVPAIIYGGHRDPVALTLDQHELRHAAEQESFYASIIEIRVGEDLSQQAVVRDLHRHPYKPQIEHVDFMRVTADELLRIAVPIHFVGEAESPAGKASGVVIQHQMTEVEIEALPKDIPEFLSVDLSQMNPGDTVMLSHIPLPERVSIPALAVAGAHDAPIAIATHVKETQGTDADFAEVVAAPVETEAAAQKVEAGAEPRERGSEGKGD